VLLATHSLQFRVHTRVFVTLLVLLAVTTLSIAAPRHPAFERTAAGVVQSPAE
jgi:hypothetical protein